MKNLLLAVAILGGTQFIASAQGGSQFIASAQGGTQFIASAVDWDALNAAAREHAKTPIRPGLPGVRPFWNAHARAFIHPPAFDFPAIPGATAYRFTCESGRDDGRARLRPGRGRDETRPSRAWTSAVPYAPVPGDIWAALAPGEYTLRIEGGGERTFHRAAVFHGPYPPAACDYRDAARKVYAAVFAMPCVQGWRTADDPPAGYDLYCYPAKILSSMIRALCRHKADDALPIARKMADWLIAHSQPTDAPLAHFPPTYWGDRREIAVKYAGENMLHYPAHAANAYFDLADALDAAPDAARAYRDAAVSIARTYIRLQGADGTWPLKVREADGAPVRANRLLPGRYEYRMFDRVFAATGDAAFTAARDRAFAYVMNGPATTWNWDAQFEDMDPLPPYENLQKGVAVDTALRLFAAGRTDAAREIVDWCEDQFVVWSDPVHNMDWRHWKTPTALEQYGYYTPIDASMGDMIGAFAATYAATGDALFREKAKALADNITRHQRADGTIPTYFDSRKGSDWVNCMIYVADRLEFLARTLDAARADGAR